MTVVAGFDRANPPATSTTMPWLRENTNLAWVGDYLVSPNHSGTSWVGQRASLSASGWSVSPIYVGQQDPVFAPSTLNRNASSSQGITEANDAVSKAFNEGFAAGTIIYLDIEYPDMSTQMRQYVQSWCQTVESLAYKPGIYIPHGNNSGNGIALADTLVPSAELWVAHTEIQSAPSNATTYPTFSPTQDYFGAAVWQYQFTYTIQTNNGPLAPADLDVETNFIPQLSLLSNPSVAANGTLDLRNVISIIDKNHTATPNVWAFDPDGTITNYEFRVTSASGFLTYNNNPVSGTQVFTAQDLYAGNVDFVAGSSSGAITIRAKDNIGEFSSSFNLTINVTGQPTNHAPTDIQLSNISVAENSAVGTLVGLLTATDQDANQQFTFSLDSNSSGRFWVNGNRLEVAGALDFETMSLHNVTVRVTDQGNLSFTENFLINVTDVNETVAGSAHVSDFNGDHFDDALIQNVTTGEIYYANMANGQFSGWGFVANTPGWNAVGHGDIKHDGYADVVIQSQGGQIYYANMANGAFSGWGTVGNTPGYQVKAVADVNGDNYADVVIQSQGGQIYYANMANGNFSGWGTVSNTPGWNVAGAGDINHDGRADVVIQSQSGQIYYANMANGVFSGWGTVSNVPGYQVKAVADVNGDSFADIVVQNASTGRTYYANMANGNFSGWGDVANTPGWQVKDAIDINNDGFADVLFQYSDGTAYAAQMGSTGFDHWVQVTGSNGADWHLI